MLFKGLACVARVLDIESISHTQRTCADHTSKAVEQHPEHVVKQKAKMILNTSAMVFTLVAMMVTPPGLVVHAFSSIVVRCFPLRSPCRVQMRQCRASQCSFESADECTSACGGSQVQRYV